VSLCLEHGAIDETHEEIRRHLDRAVSQLEKFQESAPKELLSGIVTDLKAYSDNQVSNFTSFVETTG